MNQSVVGSQKRARVIPTSAQHLLLDFSQEQQEQGHHCRSDNRTNISENKAGDKVGLRCSVKKRQVWASPPHSPGIAAAGMSLTRPSQGPRGIVTTLTTVQDFSLSFIPFFWPRTFSHWYSAREKKKPYRQNKTVI